MKNFDAWNNFVFNSRHTDYEPRSQEWAAALARQFMSLTNRGGINSFLTASAEVDPHHVVDALRIVGAAAAAEQFQTVLDGLGHPLSASTDEERWDFMERHWSDEMEDLDLLSDASDKGLLAALEAHVAENEPFYLGLKPVLS